MPAALMENLCAPRWRRWYLFAFFLFVFTSVRNIGYFDTTDAHSRFETMRALMQRGSVFYTTWWEKNPVATGNSIGPCLAALPFYQAAEAIYKLGYQPCPLHQWLVKATLFSTVVYSSLWMVAIFELALLFGATARHGIGLTLLCGLTTLILPYTKTFQAENLVGLCITLIVICTTIYRRTAQGSYLARAAFLFGYVITIKSELLVALPLIGLSCLFGAGVNNTPPLRRVLRPAIWLVFGLLPGLAINAWFNHARFGTPFESGYQGFVHFKHRLVPGLMLQFISVGKGLLLYCPILLFTLPWLPLLLRRWKGDLFLPYAWWAVLSLVYSKWYAPTGDVSLGPRFQVSYLPFALLPILEFFRYKGSTRRTFITFLGVTIALSVAMQVLFISTSFNDYYHNRTLAVPESERYTMIDQLHWNAPDSLLAGDFRTLRKGRLDLDFVRCLPSEGQLMVFPALWYLLAAAAAFGALVWHTVRHNSCATGRKFVAPFSPAFLLLGCGLFQLGSTHGKGLRVTYESPGFSRNQTWAYRIDLDFLNDARREVLFGSVNHVTWEGEFLAQTAGDYEFQYALPGRPTLHMGQKMVRLLPGRESVVRLTLSEGWHRFRIVCANAGVYEKAKFRVRLRGETKFRHLHSKMLRH